MPEAVVPVAFVLGAILVDEAALAMLEVCPPAAAVLFAAGEEYGLVRPFLVCLQGQQLQVMGLILVPAKVFVPSSYICAPPMNEDACTKSSPLLPSISVE
jgi:hypothetical protein